MQVIKPSSGVLRNIKPNENHYSHRHQHQHYFRKNNLIMCRSYTFKYLFCGHFSQTEYRFCPERDTTCQGVEERGDRGYTHFCESCYLDPELSTKNKRIDTLEERMQLVYPPIPAPLDPRIRGDIWARVRDNIRLYYLRGSDLDALADILNDNDSNWLYETLRHMELDILYRLEISGGPFRNEKDIMLMLRLARCLQRHDLDAFERSFERTPVVYVDHVLKPVEELVSLDEDDRHCSICLESFGSTASPEDPCRITLCGHVFGSACIRTWLKTEKNCPVCRKDLTESPDNTSESLRLGNALQVTRPWWLTIMLGGTDPDSLTGPSYIYSRGN